MTERQSFWDDAKKKLEEVAWWVAIALLKWLLDKVTGNPGPEGEDADNGE
jgi:hypothetical protein